MKKSDKTKKTIIKIDEDEVKTHLGRVVRETVEETLNGMLDAEADALCKAQRYQRSPDRAGKRSGYYKRNLETTGKCRIENSKIGTIPFESAIIEVKRREVGGRISG
jgi:transposase-like protein